MDDPHPHHQEWATTQEDAPGSGRSRREVSEACRKTSLHVLLWPKDSTILNSIDLEQVSILDDLVGEEASLSTIRGSAAAPR